MTGSHGSCEPRVGDQWGNGQRRDSDEAAFILHPPEVASLLWITGHGEPAIASAVLHETIENTEAAKADLSAHFGAVSLSLRAPLQPRTPADEPKVCAPQSRTIDARVDPVVDRVVIGFQRRDQLVGEGFGRRGVRRIRSERRGPLRADAPCPR
jgi:hypothetical protein